MSDDDRWLHPHELLGARLPITREQCAAAFDDDPGDPFLQYVGFNGKLLRLDEAALIEMEHSTFSLILPPGIW